MERFLARGRTPRVKRQPAVRALLLVLAAVVTTASARDAPPDSHYPGHAASAAQRTWMARIYDEAGGSAVWFTAAGARPAVASAVRELRGAADRGLDPADYDSDGLQRALAAAATADEVARADRMLTAALLRLLSDVRFGRVRPQDVEPHWRAPARDAGFVAALRDAAAADRVHALVDAAAPSFPVYQRLAAILPRYRALAAQPAIVLPPLPRTKVAPGDRYAGAAALRDLLVRHGDLDAAAARPVTDTYTDALAAGVQRFQRRHGLEADGVLGARTLAALAVPASARVRQIELSLERLRWLPDFAPGPLVAVNIPSFQLWGFADASRPERATISQPVIVGRALRTETPVFIGELRYVEFGPYWNVPRSILRNELLPRLARDPAILARDDMEIVGRDGTASTAVDAATLAGLQAGALRLRQRPGAKNALGGVKFGLPNAMDVYLHATPARELFARTQRDFSHGCIRVGDPAALARFALRDLPEWSPERIEAAMAAWDNRTVNLPAPIPVVVFYTTAIVDGSGQALFLPDVYGHDRALAAALARR